MPEDLPELRESDALLIIDIQNDFLPGGALAVPGGDEIIPFVNQMIELFKAKGLTIVATRDWHPKGHVSFVESGGPWPAHCVKDTPGAMFPEQLLLPDDVIVVSKATGPEKDAYSGFDGTGLSDILSSLGIKRVFVCGLATDYCVKATVLDAIKLGFEVIVLTEGIRAVNLSDKDGEIALSEMNSRGAKIL